MTAREIFDDSAQWLTGTTGETLLREVEENRETFRLENVVDRLAEKPLLCVAGALDIYTRRPSTALPLAARLKPRAAGNFRSSATRQTTFFRLPACGGGSGNCVLERSAIQIGKTDPPAAGWMRRAGLPFNLRWRRPFPGRRCGKPHRQCDGTAEPPARRYRS